MASEFPPMVRDDPAALLGSGVIRRTGDTAKLLYGRGRYQQPKLEVPGTNLSFIWPGGTEGIRIFGAATVAEHKYIGDNKLVVQVTHRDAKRISMTGMFSGITASSNVAKLLDVITAIQPSKGKLLSIPGVFVKQHRVVVENYDFDHNEEDRTDSFTYTIQFVDEGVGAKLPSVKTIVERVSLTPISKAQPRGATHRVFYTKNGANTLRAVAAIVYGNSARWKDIYNKNRKILDTLNVSQHILPIKTLPYGLKLNY